MNPGECRPETDANFGLHIQTMLKYTVQCRSNLKMLQTAVLQKFD